MKRWVWLAIYVVWFLIVNWPWAYVEQSSELVGTGVLQQRQAAITMAGWPCTYYQSSGIAGDEPVKTFSWLAMFANLGAWSLAAGAMFLYFRLSRCNSRQKEEMDQDLVGFDDGEAIPQIATRKSDSKLKLSDLFVATAIVALAFSYWQLIRSRHTADLALASEIVAVGGTAKLVSRHPAFLVSRIPPYVSSYYDDEKIFARLSTVILDRPKDALLEKVVRLPYLTSLQIESGEYDLRKLDNLPQNPMLMDLSILGRELDSQAIQTIGQIKSLRHLNLMRTKALHDN